MRIRSRDLLDTTRGVMSLVRYIFCSQFLVGHVQRRARLSPIFAQIRYLVYGYHSVPCEQLFSQNYLSVKMLYFFYFYFKRLLLAESVHKKRYTYTAWIFFENNLFQKRRVVVVSLNELIFHVVSRSNSRDLCTSVIMFIRRVFVFTVLRGQQKAYFTPSIVQHYYAGLNKLVQFKLFDLRTFRENRLSLLTRIVVREAIMFFAKKMYICARL